MRFDHVNAGGCAAGCVVANRRSAWPSGRVLLAEASHRIARTIRPATSAFRMGPDPMSGVDDWLWAEGVDGLRIAVASTVPAVVWGNTFAPAIMIEQRASGMLLEGARTSRV